jgi:hypothetical protein
LLLYADDAVLFADSRLGLQNALEQLGHYCKKWKLILNTDKTKVIVFKKGGKIDNREVFMYDGKQIEKVNTFKYLGIVLSANGSNCKTQKTLTNQARKATFVLLKNTKRFFNMPIPVLMDLFDKCITPIINYGSEIWGFYEAIDIERLQLWFCKLILKVRTSTMNEMVYMYGELGRFPMLLRRKITIVKYWIKLLHCPDNRLFKRIYCAMYY